MTIQSIDKQIKPRICELPILATLLQLSNHRTLLDK